MVEIKIKTKIDAPVEKVWCIISRIDDDYKFWNLTKSIRNISKDRNEIIREVRFGKTDRCYQRILLFPKDGINTHWTKGVITGTKDIILTDLNSITLLEVQIDYTISGPARLFPGRMHEELQIEAEIAVDLIKEKAEGKPHTIPMVERKSWADLIHE